MAGFYFLCLTLVLYIVQYGDGVPRMDPYDMSVQEFCQPLCRNLYSAADKAITECHNKVLAEADRKCARSFGKCTENIRSASILEKKTTLLGSLTKIQNIKFNFHSNQAMDCSMTISGKRLSSIHADQGTSLRLSTIPGQNHCTMTSKCRHHLT